MMLTTVLSEHKRRVFLGLSVGDQLSSMDLLAEASHVNIGGLSKGL